MGTVTEAKEAGTGQGHAAKSAELSVRGGKARAPAEARQHPPLECRFEPSQCEPEGHQHGRSFQCWSGSGVVVAEATGGDVGAALRSRREGLACGTKTWQSPRLHGLNWTTAFGAAKPLR